MPPDKAKAPAEGVKTHGRGEWKNDCTDQFSERHAKPKNGNGWYQDRGRYLLRSGPNGSTVFDTWVWFGEPLPRRCA
jgi:hypothetical protein